MNTQDPCPVGWHLPRPEMARDNGRSTQVWPLEVGGSCPALSLSFPMGKATPLIPPSRSIFQVRQVNKALLAGGQRALSLGTSSDTWPAV